MHKRAVGKFYLLLLYAKEKDTYTSAFYLLFTFNIRFFKSIFVSFVLNFQPNTKQQG